MFENPRRGRQARNFTTNVPKILVLKSSSEQIFSRKLPLGAPVNHIQIRNDIISSSVSMPAIYRVSQKFVPLLYKSVMRYDWSLVRKSRRQIVKLTIVPSDSNIRFLYFHTKGEWARVYFSATYFFAFFNSLNSPNCSNSLCFFVNIMKVKPPKDKNVQPRESI